MTKGMAIPRKVSSKGPEYVCCGYPPARMQLLAAMVMRAARESESVLLADRANWRVRSDAEGGDRIRHHTVKGRASQGGGEGKRQVLALAGWREAGKGRMQGGREGGSLATPRAMGQGVQPTNHKHKHKGPKSSVPRAGGGGWGGKGGGSGNRGSANSFQHNGAPRAYGFGPLVPSRNTPVLAGSGRNGADREDGDARPAVDPAAQVDNSVSDQAAARPGPPSARTAGVSAADETRCRNDDAQARNRCGSNAVPGIGASLPMGSSGHTFPRLLPMQELACCLEAQHSCARSQWSRPAPLAPGCVGSPHLSGLNMNCACKAERR